ncbi:MAG: hypothetical protein CVT49_14720 [candidate division Zixibacteria bacterium HGW-Zixibacteria-1]|nr:MAG: hypothetical protein CVT49_14720 [candidate division Zixibacteria bacterium HGW-Zixibacteria-1]
MSGAFSLRSKSVALRAPDKAPDLPGLSFNDVVIHSGKINGFEEMARGKLGQTNPQPFLLQDLRQAAGHHCKNHIKLMVIPSGGYYRGVFLLLWL